MWRWKSIKNNKDHRHILKNWLIAFAAVFLAASTTFVKVKTLILPLQSKQKSFKDLPTAARDLITNFARQSDEDVEITIAISDLFKN